MGANNADILKTALHHFILKLTPIHYQLRDKVSSDQAESTRDIFMPYSHWNDSFDEQACTDMLNSHCESDAVMLFQSERVMITLTLIIPLIHNTFSLINHRMKLVPVYKNTSI